MALARVDRLAGFVYITRMPKLYRNAITPMQFPPCCYCGEPATCREHFRPWSIHEAAWVIPSCAPCNHTLRTASHRTFSERCWHIERRLSSRTLTGRNTDWAAVLDGTKGQLRRRLLGLQAKAEKAARRLAWLVEIASAVDIRLDDLRLGTVQSERLSAEIRRMEQARLRAAQSAQLPSLAS